MNTRFLGTLCAVADTGSLVGAARATQLSSATVAEQIQALERELGVRLVERQGRTVTLTDEGRAVVDAGREILVRVADLTQVAQLGRFRGNLRIGSVSTALMTMVPPTLRYMAEHYPQISLKIVPGTSFQLYNMLEMHEIDCAITILPKFDLVKGFGWHLVRYEPLTLVCPPDLRVSSVAEVLASYPFIRMYRNSPTGRIVSEFLNDKKIVPNELFEIEAAEMILKLVSQDVGVSLLPDYGFASNDDRRLVKVRIDDCAYVRPIGIIYRRGVREALINLLYVSLSGLQS